MVALQIALAVLCLTLAGCADRPPTPPDATADAAANAAALPILDETPPAATTATTQAPAVPTDLHTSADALARGFSDHLTAGHDSRKNSAARRSLP